MLIEILSKSDRVYFRYHATKVTNKGAFADREKNRKGLVSGGGSGGSGGRGGGGSKGGGGSGSGSDNGGGADQSSNPLQAFCNSSISLHLETHFFRK